MKGNRQPQIYNTALRSIISFKVFTLSSFKMQFFFLYLLFWRKRKKEVVKIS